MVASFQLVGYVRKVIRVQRLTVQYSLKGASKYDIRGHLYRGGRWQLTSMTPLEMGVVYSSFSK